MGKDYEKNLNELIEYMEKNMSEDADDKEINKLIEQYVATHYYMLDCSDDDEEPDVYYYLELAENAKTKAKKIEYLTKATELDPDNLDAAFELIVAKCNNEIDIKNGLAELIEKENCRMTESGYLKDNAGDFWAIIETRPYMRLRYAYFDILIYQNMMRAAAAEGEEMLKLCEDDNLGVRYRLLAIYMILEDEKAFLRIKEKYNEDDSSTTMLAASLLYFKLNKLQIAEEYLEKLSNINKSTKKFITAVADEKIFEYVEKIDSDDFKKNSMDELVVAFKDNTLMYGVSAQFFIWAKNILKSKKKTN